MNSGELTSSMRHLRAYQMVVQQRNIRKAAQAVCLTQPAVSGAIAKIESQVGAQLFERRSSGTFLSPAGALLATRIDRVFLQFEKAFLLVDIPLPNSEAAARLAMRLTRAQLRALASVANLHRDADTPVITRASIIRALREMEKVLGLALVHEDTHGLVATESGRVLADRLGVALRELDWGIEDARAETGRRDGVLRVGAMPMSGTFVLAPVLNDATRQFPDARFEVISGDNCQMSRALLSGEIDLIVGLLCTRDAEGRDRAPEIETVAFAAMSYVLVARQNHPLARRASLTPADLAGFEWVTPNPQTARRRTFNWLVSQMPEPPKEDIRASSLSTVQIILSGSDRLALLTRFEYEQQRSASGLVALQIGKIEPTDEIGILYRPDWVPTHMQSAFIDIIRRHTIWLARNNADAAPAKRRSVLDRGPSEPAWMPN